MITKYKFRRYCTGILPLTGMLFTGLAFTVNTQAQDNILMVDVGPCIALESAVQRFACYEAQANAALTGGESYQAPVTIRVPDQDTSNTTVPMDNNTAPAAPAVVPNITTSPTATSSSTMADNDASFGLPVTVRNEADKDQEMFSTITALRELEPAYFMITLANGQVWNQTVTDRTFRFSVGDEVRIYSSSWGEDSRMSVIGKRGYIQVERVR